MVRCDGELARGLEGWNTFDTDNNEKKAGQQTQENSVGLCCCSSERQRAGPCSRRTTPCSAVDAVAVSVASVTSVESVIKNPRGVPSGRAVLPNTDRGLCECHSTDVTNSTKQPHRCMEPPIEQASGNPIRSSNSSFQKAQGHPERLSAEQRSMNLGTHQDDPLKKRPDLNWFGRFLFLS